MHVTRHAVPVFGWWQWRFLPSKSLSYFRAKACPLTPAAFVNSSVYISRYKSLPSHFFFPCEAVFGFRPAPFILAGVCVHAGDGSRHLRA